MATAGGFGPRARVGHRLGGRTSVGRLLNRLGYRLQAVQKSRAGAKDPDRNAQFEYINATATDYLQRREPVISVDTKKKELVGNFKNSGRERQPTSTPEKVLVHDFPQDATGNQRAITVIPTPR